MITIGTTTVHGGVAKYHFTRYTRLMFDDGFCLYERNGKPSTKEDNQKDYVDLTGRTEFPIKIEESKTTLTDEEYLTRLENSIDKYVEYIDNGRQYDEAVKRNHEIECEIKQFKELFAKHSKYDKVNEENK